MQQQENGYIALHRQIMQWEWYTDLPTKSLFLHLLLLANHKSTTWRKETVRRGQVLTGRKRLAEETGLSEQEVRTALEKLKSTNEITIRATNRYSLITINKYTAYQKEARVQQPTTNQQAVSVSKALQKNDLQAKKSKNGNQQINQQSNQQSNQQKDAVTINKTTACEDGEEGVNQQRNQQSNQQSNQQPTTSNKKKEECKTLSKESVGETKRKRFVRPSKEETLAFFLSEGSAKDEAAAFWYHYDAQDWCLKGGTKMKRWQSAAKKWIINAKRYNGNGTAQRRNGTLGHQQPVSGADVRGLVDDLYNDPRFADFKG